MATLHETGDGISIQNPPRDQIDRPNHETVSQPNSAEQEQTVGQSERNNSTSAASTTTLQHKWTSNRANLVLAVVVLALTLASYLSQLQSNVIGKKANEIAQTAYREQLWKDCQDRPEIRDTKLCTSMLNTPFDGLSSLPTLATRDVAHFEDDDFRIRSKNEDFYIPPKNDDFYIQPSAVNFGTCSYLGFTQSGNLSALFFRDKNYIGDMNNEEGLPAKTVDHTHELGSSPESTFNLTPNVSTSGYTLISEIISFMKRPNVFAIILLTHTILLLPLRDLKFTRERRHRVISRPRFSFDVTDRDSTSFTGTATITEYCLATFVIFVWSSALLVIINSVRTGLTGDLACTCALMLLVNMIVWFEPEIQRLRSTSFPPPDYPLSAVYAEAVPRRHSVVELAGRMVVSTCRTLYLGTVGRCLVRRFHSTDSTRNPVRN